jgi:hypothetical protein
MFNVTPCGIFVGEGDVLGVMIYLPRMTVERKEILESRRWKGPDSYQQIKVPLPLPTSGEGSEIRYFINGKDICEGSAGAFTNLNLGKYYPAISLFCEASVNVNFGPKFEFPPQNLKLWPGSAKSDDAMRSKLQLEALHDMHKGLCYPFMNVRNVLPCVKLGPKGVLTVGNTLSPIKPKEPGNKPSSEAPEIVPPLVAVENRSKLDSDVPK